MAEASNISAAGMYHSELTASQGRAPFMTDVNSKKIDNLVLNVAM